MSGEDVKERLAVALTLTIAGKAHKIIAGSIKRVALDLWSWGFEGEVEFPQVGVALFVIGPGEPIGMYHWEADQEGFLVLSGEAILIVEGQERPLRRWDFFHCPPGTEHIIVGASDEPAVVLAVGARGRRRKGLVYPVSQTAVKRGAGVKKETVDASEAYGGFADWKRSEYREGWLPDL